MRFAIRTKIQVSALVALLALSLTVVPTPTSAQNATLYNWALVNNTRTDIIEVHLVRSGAANWGYDVMGKRNGSLDSGETFTLHVAAGEWDIRLVTQNGDTCDTKHVKVFQPLTWRITNDWIRTCVARGN
jgi:hypothetical protein